MSDLPTDGPDPNVRRDVGGWISGPCLPSGSTPHRELFRAIVTALDCPPPATVQDEMTYFRVVRDRARVVLLTVARLVSDREAGDLDVMAAAAASIREQLADFPTDGYDHNPLAC